MIAERRAAAGLGYSLIKPLLSEVDVAGVCRDARETCQEMGDSDTVDLLSANGLYVLLNTLRRAYADHPSEQLAQQIRWFQRRRDLILEGTLQSTRKAYSMELIVNSLLLAGFLRNVGHYADALRFATVAAIQDPALQKHILSGLFMVKASPSPSTLRRHQLTIHMGHCLLEQELTARFLEKGCVRHSQVDSSPQGFMDWVMHGSRTMLNEQLVDAKKAADCLADDSVDDNTKKAAAAELEEMLAMVQGVPSGVGSGRQSCVRKAHSLIHSNRLRCPSWKGTAALVNSTAVFCGDMGVESGLSFFKRSLKTLFGRWVPNVRTYAAHAYAGICHT